MAPWVWADPCVSSQHISRKKQKVFSASDLFITYSSGHTSNDHVELMLSDLFFALLLTVMMTIM